jgi:ATP-dependent exoDNAse (exonuclease V) beta subunit
MTVHKAKGLEFPVVVLADITAAMTFPHASRVIDPEERRCAQRIGGWLPVELLEGQEVELGRDAAESVRLAYVAATRARDLLVVPAVGDERYENGWVSPLNHAIYPVSARWQEAMPAPGCPAFGTESAIRPDYAAFSVEGVRPGQHRLHEGRPDLRVVELDEEGQPLVLDPVTGTVEAEEREDAADHGAAYHVVWWDPKVLELDAQRLYGVRRSDLISKDVDEAVVQTDVERYCAWESLREQALERAARPSLRLRAATEVAAEGSAATHEVEFVELPRGGRRPAGPRFGALVHAVLATVALDAGVSEIERSARLQARILGATEEEIEAAQRVVVAVLEHPLLQRARAAAADGRCRRETPVMFLDAEGVLIDGVVDLAFLEDDVWIVLEFKTDSEIGGNRQRYEKQVDLYAEAIARASGQRAQPVLVKV